MADMPLRPDSVRANPETASVDSFRHSRRAMLGAVLALPAVSLPSLPAFASASDWQGAIAAHRRADAAMRAFDRDVLAPVREACQADLDAIPHVGSEFVDVTGFKYPMSTRHDWAVRDARKEVAKAECTPDDQPYRDYCQMVVDGADAREAEAIRIRAAHQLDEIWARAERLGDTASDALDRAIGTPAGNLAELREKMEVLDSRDAFDVGEYIDAVMADVRRLIGKGH